MITQGCVDQPGSSVAPLLLLSWEKLPLLQGEQPGSATGVGWALEHLGPSISRGKKRRGRCRAKQQLYPGCEGLVKHPALAALLLGMEGSKVGLLGKGMAGT